MAEPFFSQATEDLWAALPQLHRDQDRLATVPVDGYPMKRFVSAISDQLGIIFDLIERFDYEPADSREFDSEAVSELADAWLADVEWLPWIGQLIGVRRSPGMTDDEFRAAVASGTTGFRAGTKGSIAAAVQAVLTGTQSVAIYDHSIDDPDDGGEWDVLIVTRGSESPSSAEVIAAATNAKPAGVVLHHRTTEVDWTTLMAERPTWAAWATTWTEIHETGA